MQAAHRCMGVERASGTVLVKNVGEAACVFGEIIQFYGAGLRSMVAKLKWRPLAAFAQPVY